MQSTARPFCSLPVRLLLGLCLLCGLMTVQAAPAPAGHVIIAKGEVLARSAAGEARSLRRRSPFYAGETLVTGSAATAQLRFSDGALVALKPDTEFRVDRYRYEAEGGEGDESISTLIKGGFRTITGAVGKQDPDSYRVETPVATIGVRGTHYEAVVGEELSVAVWQGGVTVRNEGGALNLGEGASYSFATIGGADQPPRGQLKPPPGLEGGPRTQPTASEEDSGQEPDEESQGGTTGTEETAAGDEGGTTDTDGGTTETTGDSTETGTETQTTTVDSDTSTDDTTLLESDTLDDGTSLDTGSGDSLDTTTDTTLSRTTDTTLDTTFTTSEPVNTVSEITSQDARLSDTEWQQIYSDKYLGIILEANSASKGIRGGRAIADPAGSPVFTDNGYAPFDPEYADAPILEVFRRGNAALDALGNHTVDSNHTVYWGVWNGSPDPVLIQTDPNDPTVTRTSNRPFFWATLQPTDPTVLAARTGVVSYNNLIAVQGGGSGGQITAGDVTFNLDVNFDTGALTNGYLQIGNGTELWEIDLSGQLKGSLADLVVEPSSTVTDSPSVYGVVGDIATGFTGNNGEVLGGGFLFEAEGNPGIHAEGILLVD